MTTLLWVNAFKSDIKDGDNWLEHFVDQLLDRVQTTSTGASTATAEAKCGFDASVYWYVASPQEAYTGGILSLWEASENEKGNGGVCPFDTGGMVIGKINTEPPLKNDAERIAYLEECDRDLDGWLAFIQDKIAKSYGRVTDYVTGGGPHPPMTPRDHSANASPQAWTWESRMTKDSHPYTRTSLRYVVAPTIRFRRLFEWLRVHEDDFTVTEFERLTDLLAAVPRVEATEMLRSARDLIVDSA